MSNDDISRSVLDADQAISAAKRILLSNKVQQFTSESVVSLAEIILRRESELIARTQQETQSHE